jgi:RNA polymerase sigma-70 factor (ECF subfamily)
VASAAEHRPWAAPFGEQGGAIAGVLVELWARIEREHAHRPIEPDAFFAYLAARVDPGAPGALAARLAAVHVEDLYLACACAARDPGALQRFEDQIVPRVEGSLAGMRIADTDRRDALQALRERMLAAEPAAITKYDGRGPLASWLKVCAVRIARERTRRERRHVSLDEGIGDLAPGVPDPELAYLRRRYEHEFRSAFAAAVEAMPPRQRTLLRLSIVDELGIDQIAAIYHVHRATAARRIRDAREELVARTRAEMAAKLQLGPAELDSVLRLILSIADVTLRRLLPARRGASET